MLKFPNTRVVLLDIEGTVSDVRFVYDVLFPYAAQNMRNFLQANWSNQEVQSAIQQVAVDAGFPAKLWTDEPDLASSIESLNTHLHSLMQADSKTTGLKALEGLVWQHGFETGQLRSILFDDILPAFQRWKSLGLEIAIYSSGSVLAQQLFFRYTTQGDLARYLSKHFDTTIGKKQEPSSYQAICEKLDATPSSVLFISDISEELIAAESVGLKVVASLRPNNKPLSEKYQGPRVNSFERLLVTS